MVLPAAMGVLLPLMGEAASTPIQAAWQSPQAEICC